MKIVEKAVRELEPEKIWIFGSRARGDQAALSDIDIAFAPKGDEPFRWSRFAVEAEEEAGTLLELDLVNMNEAPGPLKRRIQESGILIYVRRKD